MPWLLPLLLVAGVVAVASNSGPIARDAPPKGPGDGDIEDLPIELQKPVTDLLAMCAAGSIADPSAADNLATLLRSKGYAKAAARLQGCADGARARGPSPASPVGYPPAGFPPAAPSPAGFPPAPVAYPSAPVPSPVPVPSSGGMVASLPSAFGGGQTSFAPAPYDAKKAEELAKERGYLFPVDTSP